MNIFNNITIMEKQALMRV